MRFQRRITYRFFQSLIARKYLFGTPTPAMVRLRKYFYVITMLVSSSWRQMHRHQKGCKAAIVNALNEQHIYTNMQIIPFPSSEVDIASNTDAEINAINAEVIANRVRSRP
ncbi:unnamed protein product [Amoebophrya sp. A25]|nr:unnamed protein product [Amoebophrya sp. A25]|eukprot:GSA25T00027081001.1